MQYYANYLLIVIYLHRDYFVMPKTCQKPYAKTPQKTYLKIPLGQKSSKNLL
jgi:hypothetical protein